MTSKQIQLHALPEDVPAFLEMLVETDANVCFCAGKSSAEFEPLLSINDARDFAEGLVYIIASLHPIESRNRGFSDILRENPGVMTIIYPVIWQGCASEITLSAISDVPDDPHLAVWAKFIRRLRKRLVSGAFVQNVETGFGRFYKNAHATENAVSASRMGLVRLTSGNGGVVFTYGEPSVP